MDFKPGDVVRMKGSMKRMVIKTIKDDAADCVWENTEGGLVTTEYPLIVLEHDTDTAREDIRPW